MGATEVRAMVRRKELFQRYARDAGLDADQLAIRLMLSPARIHDLLSGRAPISNELATHIEEMLQLPASWLDQGGALEPGDPPMIDAPTQAPAQAAIPAAEAQPAALANPAGVAVQARASTDKKQIHEHRRLNLTMLTAERGTKNRLAQLAGTSGSRISLMTSARKPVSDPFAFAIEDGLGLPRGWLDQPRSPDSVPAAVWQSLQVDRTAAGASTAAAAAAAPAATPTRPAAAAHPRQPSANAPRASAAAAALAPAALAPAAL
ncbi:MAG: helix-turn-helix domain-containing protein, partial [Thauera sp.]|nr:helix-turn-helix domain-containing protein [Thauera sp.]